MYVVIARYTVQPGEEAAVELALAEMTPLSRAEPGCLLYQVQRSLENPSLLVLVEGYVDEAAYRAHTESAHFGRLILGDAVPRLVTREREFFETLS